MSSNVDSPLGIWAAIISRLDWPTARDGVYPASDLLYFLSTLKLMREPVFRPSPRPIIIMIAASVQSTEASMMQVTGSVACIPCERCAGGGGMFTQCVTVTGWPGLGHCANCHADGTEDSCHLSYPITSVDGGNETHSNME
ncbi:hypothetical protein PENSTE_c011G06585 [Penicillium steckii]|uniref:Uncharacterized protein n=1 Tax=Penicillium steckii TaxID=303698 RepID=A0A1V6T7H1_9EURO|nr:hypothetical protein PENSTE_c011G06585 [Penicillium steckii]